MKKMMFVAMAIVFAAGALSAYVAADYMPLTVGNYWVYSDSSEVGLDSSRTDIAGTSIWEGTPCFIMENIDYEYSEIETSFVYFDSGSLWIVQYDSEEGDHFLVLFLPAVFDIGSTWDVIYMDTSWTEDPYEYFYTIHSSAVLEAVENVVTPAGLFMNCLKISQSGYFRMTVLMDGTPIYSDSSDLDINYIWIGEDAGVVKDYTFDTEDSTESVSLLIRSNLTGIDEAILPSVNAIAAFPNPFNAAVTIDVPENTEEIEVYDAMGKLVDTVPVDFGQARWNPSRETAAGMYLVKAKSGGRFVSKKIVFLK
ncbi:T9SS type A sorting domain-containing protein [bacterium]|nr:T9SS type A sorting domain-containing protein [bacterium]